MVSNYYMNTKEYVKKYIQMIHDYILPNKNDSVFSVNDIIFYYNNQQFLGNIKYYNYENKWHLLFYSDDYYLDAPVIAYSFNNDITLNINNALNEFPHFVKTHTSTMNIYH